MKAYADTSFLGSLFIHDDHHDVAAAYMQEHEPEVWFTPLSGAELQNAFFRRVFNQRQGKANASTLDEAKAAWSMVEDYVAKRVLAENTPDWPRVCERARALTERHTPVLGNRTLDVLQVASALVSGAKLFLSFDDRQRTIAKAEGLAVGPGIQ